MAERAIEQEERRNSNLNAVNLQPPQRESSIERGEKYCYLLEIFGSDATVAEYKKAEGRDFIWKIWDPNTPFVLKRKSFPPFSGHLRLSRRHLTMVCEKRDNIRKIFALDLSTNGTVLNEIQMNKKVPYELIDGDEIGLIWRKNAELNCIEVLFGLRISYFDEKNAPVVPSDDFKPEPPPPPPVSKPTQIERKISKEYVERKTRNTNPDPIEQSLSLTDSNSELSAVEGRRGVDRAMKWTSEEEEKLLRIMDSGETHSWKDVALHFPLRSPDAVRNKYKKMMDVAPHRKKQKTTHKVETPHAISHPPPPFQTTLVEQISPRSEPTPEPPSAIASSTNAITTASIVLPSKEDRTRKFWTTEEDELLKEMVIEKKPSTPDEWEEIATIMGRTVKSIKHKYNDKKYYELVNQTR